MSLFNTKLSRRLLKILVFSSFLVIVKASRLICFIVFTFNFDVVYSIHVQLDNRYTGVEHPKNLLTFSITFKYFHVIFVHEVYTYFLTYLPTYLLHGAEPFLRS